MHLIDIHSPEDLKRCDAKALPAIAREMREKIIAAVAQNGGHLASNLGVVELTIALHRAFDFPTDRLVFDVGHQCYAHKLLTGRGDSFEELRRFGGLAGFPRREESVYDCFDTGHASTAISAAVGFARARDLRGEKRHVVAVVGDGALTGGMCYEALNDAGSNKLRMIVVLNDNGMSISRNVGAVSGYLTHMRSSKGWFEAKRHINRALKRIPVLGMPLHRVFHRFKDSVRNIFVQDRLFDSLGFHYLGPVDGNDVYSLERLLRRAKELDEPVLIHMVTQKGRGYIQAEANPTQLHGTPPFDPQTGKALSDRVPSMGETAGDELCSLAQKDRRVVAVTAAMTDNTGLTAFAQHAPARLFDVGIAEEHAVTMAAGMASGGLRPFVAIYDTFLQRAYDQLLHDVCLQHLPVCFLIDRAGMSEDGATHHGIYGIAYLSQLPGMQVLCATSRSELRAMMRYALTQNGPVAIRYAKAENKQRIAAAEEYSPAWQCLKKGNAGAILACGSMVDVALEAAKALPDMAIYNASCVCPLDEKALLALAGVPLVTLEEGVLAGGFGSAVTRWRMQQGKAMPMLTLGIEGLCSTQGAHDLQLRAQRLDSESVIERITQWRKEIKA